MTLQASLSIGKRCGLCQLGETHVGCYSDGPLGGATLCRTLVLELKISRKFSASTWEILVTRCFVYFAFVGKENVVRCCPYRYFGVWSSVVSNPRLPTRPRSLHRRDGNVTDQISRNRFGIFLRRASAFGSRGNSYVRGKTSHFQGGLPFKRNTTGEMSG